MRDPFSAVEAALSGGLDDTGDESVRIDFDRQQRTGIPEVIYGDSKSDAQVLMSCTKMLERRPRTIVSRIAIERAESIASSIGLDIRVEQPFAGQTVVLSRGDARPPMPSGFVGIITAGTSDLPAAGEAATVISEIGCRVELVADVGVAGLHRLVQPLRRIINAGADVIIVAAGMDGALPSVVSGLVDIPVIGLPTSVGYGVAAGGQAALMTML
ncbi:MAG TPA: nickel pincer cofactor biosynthesis protein LarB, partial [Thermomicrobiales bacterium]|nr:nickel pincer cofactor biosynthesis protein LarB [Thermomicrobiales bacterium]